MDHVRRGYILQVCAKLIGGIRMLLASMVDVSQHLTFFAGFRHWRRLWYFLAFATFLTAILFFWLFSHER